MEYVMVFGGTGYVGSAIVRACETAHFSCIRVSRKPSPESKDIVCDIADKTSLEARVAELYARQDSICALVHAASPSLSRVREGSETSASREEHDSVAQAGTEHLIALASRYTIPHLILITSEVVERAAPSLALGSYRASKVAQQELAQEASRTLASLVHTITPGFLPGGLNGDLPHAFRESLASKDGIRKSPEDVGRTVVAILRNDPRYQASGSINPHTEVLTPF